MHAEKPVALYPGLGTWHHPIGTTNPDAQKFFDQGLVLMYGFNRYEAIRSFTKSADLDPGAAMAYWGIAMSTGPYLNMEMDSTYNMKQSCEAVKKGLAVKELRPTDRSWLEVAGSRCPDFSDPNHYVSAMRALAEQHPDDPDAQTLYAEALLVRVRWRWYDARG